jgi:YedE family putative selenium metabolism protein
MVALFGLPRVSGRGILLNKGFSLGRSYPQQEPRERLQCRRTCNGRHRRLPSYASEGKHLGTGSQHAPILISLAAGLIVVRSPNAQDVHGRRNSRPLSLQGPNVAAGSAAVLVVALILNVATGSFKLGFTGQPIAHTQWLWNFLGMGLVGYGSVLLGGCPLRQTILAGEGNSDSAVTVLGFLAGAAVSHNFGLASSGQGATTAGKIATLVGFAVITLIALAVMKKQARS